MTNFAHVKQIKEKIHALANQEPTITEKLDWPIALAEVAIEIIAARAKPFGQSSVEMGLKTWLAGAANVCNEELKKAGDDRARH
jgi:hypothetical protein